MRKASDLREPKEIIVLDQHGNEHAYIISAFLAMDGREIITQYPTSAAPKIGDYKVNEELMLKLMKHVAVVLPSGNLVLETRALIDNHCPDYEVLMRLEYATLEYNCSFLRAGKLSNYLELMTENLQGLITKILTRYSASSSESDKPPTKNSKKS